MQRQRAFSLLELSIVLVIIGLLVGAVVVGKSLLQGQRIRAVLQDAKTYAVAIQQFNDKYGALPGDMPNAVRIWGRADGGTDLTQNCASPTSNASNGTTTCNGNGNGIIDGSEGFWAWQQLSAAGMINGSYTGVHSGSGANEASPSVNTPQGALDNSVYSLNDWGNQDGSGAFFPGDYASVMAFGAPITGDWPWGAMLKAQEAYLIDHKIDDSLPGLGNVRALHASVQGNCATSDTPATAVYALDVADVQVCAILFLRSFQAKAAQ